VKDKICTLDPKESALKDTKSPAERKLKVRAREWKRKGEREAEDDFMTFQST